MWVVPFRALIQSDPSVPNGASGFGCNTIGGTVTVTSALGTVTALVPTAAADQFNPASGINNPSPYPYSYSIPTYGPLYTGTGNTVPDTTYGIGAATASLAVGAIAGIAIFGVAYGCWYIAAAVVIFMMCKRSKRLTAAWDQPGGANYRGLEGPNVVNAYAVPTAPTPTMSPAPQQAGYFAPPPAPEQAKGVSPQQETVSPVYAPGTPAQGYPAGNVSPYQNGAQPAQPAQQTPQYAYPPQQQYVEAPAGVPQAQQHSQPGNEVSELM
jgi:hypothetical protein